MSDYSDIIERLEKATGPEYALDVKIWLDVVEKPEGKRDPDMIGREPNYTASIDAAIALVGRMLPGWRWSIGTELADDFKTTEYGGNVYPFEQPFPAEFDTYGYSQANAPIAILLALFRALEAKKGAS